MVKYREGYRYQLAEDHLTDIDIKPEYPVCHDYIILTTLGHLIIKEGYAWDGASGPTFDTKSSIRASLVHDALYQMIRLGLLADAYKQQADEELYKRLKEDGMWWWRATAWYEAVDWFGASSIDPQAERSVLCAP